MTKATVGTDVDESLDVHGNFLPKVTLNLVVVLMIVRMAATSVSERSLAFTSRATLAASQMSPAVLRPTFRKCECNVHTLGCAGGQHLQYEPWFTPAVACACFCKQRGEHRDASRCDTCHRSSLQKRELSFLFLLAGLAGSTGVLVKNGQNLSRSVMAMVCSK